MLGDFLFLSFYAVVGMGLVYLTPPRPPSLLLWLGALPERLLQPKSQANIDPKTEDLYETTLKRVYLVSCCPKLELSGHHRPLFCCSTTETEGKEI